MTYARVDFGGREKDDSVHVSHKSYALSENSFS